MKILMNDGYVMPVSDDMSPLDILALYYEGSLLRLSVPFNEWITDLITDSTDGYTQDELDTLIESTLNEDPDILLKKVFPVQQAFDKKNWENIRAWLDMRVKKKKGPDAEVTTFDAHKKSFSENEGKPMRI